MKYCVYTRSFLEDQFLNFFIEHYVKLGFDKIIILKADDTDYNCPIEYLKYVEIHKVKNEGNTMLSKYDYLVINSDYDWVLSIDIDEILLLNNLYKNIDDFVQSKLTINKDINIFYFRWAIIEKYDITEKNDFKNILENYKIFKNEHIKSMVKKTDIKTIYHPHLIEININHNIYFENNFLQKNEPKHNFSANMYMDSVLIHLHTRSINNFILKALNTSFKNKKIPNNNLFKDYINNIDVNLIDFKIFQDCIGPKSRMPFGHALIGLSNIKINNFMIFNYSYDVFNSEEDKLSIISYLNNYDINIDKYLYITNIINSLVKEKKTFIK